MAWNKQSLILFDFSCASCYGVKWCICGVWHVMGSPQSYSPVHAMVVKWCICGVWRPMGSPQLISPVHAMG